MGTAMEALIDLTEETPLRLSPAWELLSPRMGFLGRHRAADRREPEPEPEPGPLTLRRESMRLIAGSIGRDPYELPPEADPPA